MNKYTLKLMAEQINNLTDITDVMNVLNAAHIKICKLGNTKTPDGETCCNCPLNVLGACRPLAECIRIYYESLEDGQDEIKNDTFMRRQKWIRKY